MSEGWAKGPSLTALQHKWRELTVPAVRCRDPARAKPMLGVWHWRSGHGWTVATNAP